MPNGYAGLGPTFFQDIADRGRVKRKEKRGIAAAEEEKRRFGLEEERKGEKQKTTAFKALGMSLENFEAGQNLLATSPGAAALARKMTGRKLTEDEASISARLSQKERSQVRGVLRFQELQRLEATPPPVWVPKAGGGFKKLGAGKVQYPPTRAGKDPELQAMKMYGAFLGDLIDMDIVKEGDPKIEELLQRFKERAGFKMEDKPAGQSELDWMRSKLDALKRK